MADEEKNSDTPPADPKEGTSKGTDPRKEPQSLSPQDTEAIIDGLFKCLQESGIPAKQGSPTDTPGSAG